MGVLLDLMGVSHVVWSPLLDDRTEDKIIDHQKSENSNLRMSAFNYAYAA